MQSAQFHLRPLSVFVGLALALPGAALRADDGKVLDAVVVTASSIETTLRDAPASISVLTREDIESKPVQELAELIGTVEGVTLTRSGNLVPGIQIRGMDKAYTLMLIDGRRVNSTNAMFRGNDYDSGWVPTSEIERIEIVRGPMSSLYGSDAIGGVVNVITRKVGKTWRGSLRADAVFQEKHEAGDMRGISLSASGPLIPDVLGMRFTAGYDKRDADDDVNPRVGGTAQPGFQKIRNRYANGQLTWTPLAGHEFRLGYDTSERDHNGFIMKRDAAYLTHLGRYAFGSSELTFNFDETRNLTGVVTGQVNPNTANSDSVDGKLILPWESTGQILTLGGSWRREKLKDPALLSGWPGTPTFGTDPNAQIRQSALFLEDEISLLDNLKLTLGNRYDHHENFGGHNSPRAYLVYHLTPSITFKGGWARAFRAPTLLQGSPNWGSVSCGSPTVGCYIIGNPDLKPETSTSKEIGVTLDFGAYGGSLTLFDTELRDMISIDNRTANAGQAPTMPNFVGFLPDGRPIFGYENVARVESKGVEVGFRAQFSPQWSLRANYTYTDAKNTSTAQEQPLAYRPKHAANLSLNWLPAERWTVTGTMRHVGEQYLNVFQGLKKDAYNVADLSAAWRIDKTYTLRAGVLNIGDKGDDRLVSTDYNEEGRRYFISLGAEF